MNTFVLFLYFSSEGEETNVCVLCICMETLNRRVIFVHTNVQVIVEERARKLKHGEMKMCEQRIRKVKKKNQQQEQQKNS